MSSSNPKRPSFTKWLRDNGVVTPSELGALVKRWTELQATNSEYKVMTVEPVTWDQMLAREYPRHFLTYQTYLRLIGAAPTPKKD